MAPALVYLIVRDMQGVQRMKIEMNRTDVSEWLLKVLRHWLAWAYGSAEIRLIS